MDEREARIQKLVTVPAGWTPGTWRDRLAYLVGICQVDRRREELERAIALLNERMDVEPNNAREGAKARRED